VDYAFEPKDIYSSTTDTEGISFFEQAIDA
jgi:hypothetical protein